MDFCAKCGRKVETKEGLCDKCYSEEHPSLMKFKEVNVRVCENCKKCLLKNKWHRYNSLKDIVKKLVKEGIKGDKKADVNINIDRKEAEVRASSGEIYVVPFKIKYVTCPNCSKEQSGYYEGILQLRDVDKKVVDFCLKDAEKRREEGIFFTKIDELKNGFDLYCTSNKYVQNLAKKLKKRFGGEVKISSKLFTRNRQTSKEVYRVNVLFRLKL